MRLEVWMNDPCSFTSCCQVLDAERVTVRHESHQSNQRDPSELMCLVFTWLWLTMPDLKRGREEEKKKDERIFLLLALSYRIIVLNDGSDKSHYETKDVIRCAAEMWSNAGIYSDCQFFQWQSWHFNRGFKNFQLLGHRTSVRWKMSGLSNVAHTSSHKSKVTSRANALTSQPQLHLLPRRATVKINDRH